MATTETFSYRIADLLERRSGWLLVAIPLITALLAVPMIVKAPDENASDNPGGLVYDLEDLTNTNLPRRVHGAFFIAEARVQDVLTQKPLWELYENVQKLRQADAEGRLHPPGLPEQSYLFNGFDVDRGEPILGIFTLADAVQEALVLEPFGTDLSRASEDEVKLALHLVLQDPRNEILKDFISEQRKVEQRTVLGLEIDYWTSPAILFGVAADNGKLGGGGLRIGTTGDPVTEGKEHFNRNVQAILRGDEESYRLWGVAIDAGLEIADEVATAVPFIVATFLMVLVVVGISLRSARVVLLTAVGLAFMIVWLKGLSNLVGLNSSTVLDFIVPIAMISLGADFAIHAVNRYREERRAIAEPRRAFRVGMSGVLAALTLAMITDGIAFLSNASADIETVAGFGIGAALAILAAYVIMGIAVPLALMRLDARRASRATAGAGPESPSVDAKRPGWSLGDAVVALARRPLAVLAVAAAITAVSAFYALKLEATFDVKEFFKSSSDFAVSLDQIEVHRGRTGGEPAIIYVEGDLADPAALAAIEDFVRRLQENPYVGRSDDGEVTLQARTIFSILEQVMGSDYARAQVEAASGVTLSAEDELREFRYRGEPYRWPDSREQLLAIYDYVSIHGVPLSPNRSVYDVLEVGETLFHTPGQVGRDATSIVLGIPGTRQQANVIRSRDTLARDIEALGTSPAISRAGLTGSPYTRQAALDATADGLQRALLIAVVACLLIAVVAMRSIRYGVITIIPVGLVVAWLYGFMYLFGFGLNFVTATIAAISIGVGVDFAIHMTQRFREELDREDDSLLALHRAADGTGIALVASAATSIVGFTIMAFAPMPMFSSYGILTAVMIFLAAAVSLLVLPSMLVLVAPERTLASPVTVPGP